MTIPKISAETFRAIEKEARPAIECIDEFESEQPEFVEVALREVGNSDAVFALTWMSLIYEAIKRTLASEK